MKTNIHFLMAACLLLCVSCTQKWEETTTPNGYNLVTQTNGPELGYSPESGVQLISKG